MTDGMILVTGAAGLIGHAVAARLQNLGHTVLGIDREPARIDGHDVIACDVTDVHGLHAIARRHPLAGIVHCGAFSGPMVAADQPARMVDVNIVGTANLLELARVVGGVRVVFCSSTSACGPTPPGPNAEEIVLRPTTVYGASKAASEHLVAAFAQQHGVDGVSLRLSWVYGPRRTTPCTIREMIRDALADRPSRLPFGRNFPRQYIHVEDAAQALVAALLTPRLPKSAYAVTGGTWLTLAEIAATLRTVIPTARIDIGEGADPGDDRQGAFDISAAARDFGYRPTVALADGIARYRDWLAANR